MSTTDAEIIDLTDSPAVVEYTVRQVADLLHKKVDTIHDWRKAGKFPNAHQAGPRHNDPWMIPASDVGALEMNNQGGNPPAALPDNSPIRPPVPSEDLKNELTRERELRIRAEGARDVEKVRADLYEKHNEDLRRVLLMLPPASEVEIEQPISRYGKSRKFWRRSHDTIGT